MLVISWLVIICCTIRVSDSSHQLNQWSILIYLILHCRVGKNLNVKVADFGLSKDIYEMDYYRGSNKTRIPVKWMAPESLVDRISNEKTDVVKSQYNNSYTVE